MAHFKDRSEDEQIFEIKENFYLVLEELLYDRAKIKAVAPDDIFNAIIANPMDAEKLFANVKLADVQKKVSDTLQAEERLREAKASVSSLLEKAKLVEPETFKRMLAFLPTIIQKPCSCDTCIDQDKTEVQVPAELKPIIDISRKRCEEAVY